MRRILIHLTDEEYEKLLRVKGSKTWKDLLLSIVPKSKEELLIDKVHSFFIELEKLDPENLALYELIRVFFIIYYKKNFRKALEILEQVSLIIKERRWGGISRLTKREERAIYEVLLRYEPELEKLGIKLNLPKRRYSKRK